MADVSEPKPVLLFGATGYTGRLAAQALEAAGVPFGIAGRDRDALVGLASSLPHCVAVRVADAERPDTLVEAFKNAGCVLSTVGPYLDRGVGVMSGALAAGAHYVDTSAEQPFIRQALALHVTAVDAELTALPGAGLDYALACLGGSRLGRHLGGLTSLDTWRWLRAFTPTPGTVKSGIGMIGVRQTVFHDGTQVPVRMQVELMEHDDLRGWSVSFPGGEALLLPREFEELRHCRPHLVQSRLAASAMAAFDRVANHVPSVAWRGLQPLLGAAMSNPDPETRQASTFTFLLRGEGPRGAAWLRIDGTDVYASTAALAVHLALQLASGESRTAGVVGAGAALDADAVFDRLGLNWSIQPDPTPASPANAAPEVRRVPA